MSYNISFNLDDIAMNLYMSEVFIGAIDFYEKKTLADCPCRTKPAQAAAWNDGWELARQGKIIVKEVL